MERGTYRLYRMYKYHSLKKISGLGLISFVLSIIEAVSIYLSIAFHHDPFFLVWVMDPYLPGDSTISFFTFTGICLIPVVLGIGGLMEKDRSKVINILSILLSLLLLSGLWAIQLFIAILGDEYF
jgi:hypothetical protein